MAVVMEGTACCRAITDMHPRQLGPQELSLLKSFASMAARQVELAAAARSQAQQAYIDSHAAALCNVTHGFQEPLMLCDISNQQHWRILAVNSAWEQATGICRWGAPAAHHYRMDPEQMHGMLWCSELRLACGNGPTCCAANSASMLILDMAANARDIAQYRSCHLHASGLPQEAHQTWLGCCSSRDIAHARRLNAALCATHQSTACYNPFEAQALHLTGAGAKAGST